MFTTGATLGIGLDSLAQIGNDIWARVLIAFIISSVSMSVWIFIQCAQDIFNHLKDMCVSYLQEKTQDHQEKGALKLLGFENDDSMYQFLNKLDRRRLRSMRRILDSILDFDEKS